MAPIGVYVHWPYCGRICPYCDFNVVRARGRTEEGARLADAILRDLEAEAAWTAAAGPRQLVSIFFGGGTPSLMAPADIARIIAACRSLWTPAETVEVSLEANPTDAETRRFEAIRDAGVDRLSLGVQAFDDDTLAFLGRAHRSAETAAAVETAARVFPRLSLDLIYATPGQTADAWAAALRRAVDSGAEHLSPYQLTIEAGTAFDRAVRRGRWSPPDDALAAELYETTQTVLEAEGFHAYEVSNHARGAAARSRHNQLYWRGEDYAGVGPGAHGRLTDGAGRRFALETALRVPAYIDGPGFDLSPLDPTDVAVERALMGLRTLDGVGLRELDPLPLRRLDALVADGLLVRQDDRLIATPQGRSLLDSVVQALVAD